MKRQGTFLCRRRLKHPWWGWLANIWQSGFIVLMFRREVDPAIALIENLLFLLWIFVHWFLRGCPIPWQVPIQPQEGPGEVVPVGRR